MTEQADKRDKIAGALYGVALGDACGADTEFMRYGDILKRRKVGSAATFKRGLITVTDDTQMTLALGEALASCGDILTPERVARAISLHFVRWSVAPDNDRAPGATCLQACQRLRMGEPWQRATARHSKGCGANMRVAPVAFLRYIGRLRATDAAGLAQLQAAITHGHPTALAASDMTAWAIAELLQRESLDPSQFVAECQAYANAQTGTYHDQWLGDFADAEELASGWREVGDALDRVSAAIRTPDYITDPCEQTGAGWIAEEALATGLLCFLLYPTQPLKAIQRGAITSGDSDSVASFAGSFAGAFLGSARSWGAQLCQRVEYRGRLESLLEKFSH